MSFAISKDVLNGLSFSFSDENVTRYGLIENDWLILLLENKMRSQDFDKLIHLTGGEIVCVNVNEKWTTREILSGHDYSGSSTTEVIDQKISNRMQRIKLNTPFKVNVSGNIPEKLVFTERRTFLAVGDNVIPGVSRLKDYELTKLAKIFKAKLFVAYVEVEQTITPMVSQYRSVPASF